MCEVSQKPKLILSSCWALLKLTCQKGKGSSLRTADVFPVVASLPEEEEATTGNASAVRRLQGFKRDIFKPNHSQNDQAK